MRVFDASALLAFLFGEPGADVIEKHLTEGGVCGAANWAEVAQKVAVAETWSDSRALLQSYPLTVEPVTRHDAEHAAALWQRGAGLSLGDRLCLALGHRLDAEILTADRAWDGLPGVQLIRGASTR